MLQCPACGGYGCGQCDDGDIEIAICPLYFVEGDIWQLLRMTDLFFKGLPPVAGGVLDQTKSFIEAAGFVDSDRRYWKNKLGIIE